MTEIDREPGGSTMIRVSTEVRQMIEEEKIIPREPLNDCIKRGILQSRELRSKFPFIETREVLKRDLEEFVANPSMPSRDYYGIWLYYHPGESIQSDEIIHHINGNHNDDRPENLMKIKRTEHVTEHRKIGLDYRDGPTKSNEIVGKNV